MLRTEPSFCIYNEEGNLEENEGLIQVGEKLERSATIGDTIESQFSFGRDAMRMIEEDTSEDDDEDDEETKTMGSRFKDLRVEIKDENVSRPMYGAAGYGASQRIDSGGVEFGPSDFDDLDKYYEAMVHENWSNPLFLRNYAQYLESKRNFLGAEEYYLRATRADPKDGEILSQYAKLVWQLHRDEDTASTYFERAVQAAPEDSNVLGAYASFLWEIDEDSEEGGSSEAQADKNTVMVEQQEIVLEEEEEKRPSTPPLHLAVGLGVEPAFGFNTGDMSEDSNNNSTVEDYHKRMIEENPGNPFFLRDYAKFLHQSKGDLAGAEEYYAQAILANPGDGQMNAAYAGVVWQLHHDRDRAASYFERAVQTAPGDANVLASYAKFLWETEDNAEETGSGAHHQKPPLSPSRSSH